LRKLGKKGAAGLGAGDERGRMLKKGIDRGMPRWRAVALLAIGALIGVVMVATPAGAHVGGTVGHLWKDHIKPRADARYANAISGTDKAKNGIMGVAAFAGFISDMAPADVWQFAGPQGTVTTRAGERLVAAAEAPLEVSTNQNMRYGLCYQSTAPASAVINFVGGSYSIGELTTQRISWSASASVVPGAGTWRVGFCVFNYDTNTVNITGDYVNGWVQVLGAGGSGAPARSNIQQNSARSD
jgi:hypothetical protein